MKYTNFKTWALMLSTSALLALSGCDNGSGVSYVVEDVTPPAGVTPPPTVTPPPSTEPAEGELGYQTILPNGDIEYVDYTGGTRTSVESVAKAEYHTAVGYGNTLFDSADKKCQNCHNELYDTWKSSMHGRSWTDPIFQSKFQDFLRTHLAKINDTTYTEKKFKGVAQTCIKCHAPGAYYAGDVAVSVTKLMDNPQTADLDAAKKNNQSNMSPFDPTQATTVVSASKFTNKLYQASFQIGHEANQEGINCAFCHSVETVRMMKADGVDGGKYTLKDALREGPVGGIQFDAGETLNYSQDGTNIEMNAFFRLWGPEKYANLESTPKVTGFDIGKSKDGRYTMHSIELNSSATNPTGEVHFTGGPYYGPFGVTGKTNENETDNTNRTALINPAYDVHANNQFGNHGKALCLSCHQRSAGAIDPASHGTPAKELGVDTFMELCSTWNAVTGGSDTNHNDELTSPKCQKCHMERIEGVLLHKWARPDLRWTLADNPELTAEFNPDDTTVPAGDNPVRDGWLNSHAFLGASKTGQTSSVTAKIQSGFNATLNANASGDTLTVNTTLQNLTAHMFPGAHPMRRVLTRVIVTDKNTGTMIGYNTLSSIGSSTFTDIVNNVQPLNDKILHSSAEAQVQVQDGGRIVDFPGKTPDLDGSLVAGQKFDGTLGTVVAPDATVKLQEIVAGAIQGKVKNAAIAIDTNQSTFTRIYGHETGKMLKDFNSSTTTADFVVRPGFDSNTVPNDNRLVPNETETYTLEYDITAFNNVTVTYKVYYMQKGANGAFPTTADGWLDPVKNKDLKLLITEVGTYRQTITK